MTKTYTIDGRDIQFKAAMSFAFRYQAQFGEDVLKVFWPMIRALISSGALEKEEIGGEELAKSLEGINLVDIMRIIWTLAKTADKTIQDPIEWYDGFENFPVMEIGAELIMLVLESMQSNESLKKKVREAVKK